MVWQFGAVRPFQLTLVYLEFIVLVCTFCAILRKSDWRTFAMDTPPPLKHFALQDRLYVQAQQIWLILVAYVMEGCDRTAARPPTITYGDLAKRMGYSDGRAGRTLSRQLGIIHGYCVTNEVPVLNSIVVAQSTGMPATELSFGYEDDGQIQPEKALQRLMVEQKKVMAYDWFSVRVPTTGTFRKVWEALSSGDED